MLWESKKIIIIKSIGHTHTYSLSHQVVYQPYVSESSTLEWFPSIFLIDRTSALTMF